MKKLFKFILPVLSVVPCLATTSLSSCSKTHLRLVRTDWEDGVKTALNECIAKYGIDGDSYSKDNYVVFDFDNTSAIFDIAHQFTNYQIERMAFNMKPEELRTALGTDLGDLDRTLEQLTFTYRTLINDIVKAYKKLNDKYGPFSYEGIAETKLPALHADSDWKDFSAKLRYMIHGVVNDIEGDTARCKWSTYLLTGMTPDQVYELECKCLSYYSKIKTHTEIWTASTAITGTSVIAQSAFPQGVSVTENIKELYKAINNNGMDIWIVSASQIDQVRAAADVFGLGPYVKGCLGLTNKVGSDGIYIPAYDSNGKGYVKNNGKWEKMSVSNPHYTSEVGKSLTIKDVIAPNYNNHGPIMGFGDSSGDFNFCTEFKDTKLVVCFNRADRAVTDGGGLMAIIAMYQKDNNITLAKANENGDTLYCLQGRDDNGLRLFRNSNKTIRLAETEETLFKNNANYLLLSFIEENKLSIKQACLLCIKTYLPGVGIEVGYLEQYDGYHSR